VLIMSAALASSISKRPHLLRSIVIIFAVIVSTILSSSCALVSATSSQLSMLTLSSSAAACCRMAVSLVTIGGGRCSSSSITAFARQQQYAPQSKSTLSFITPVVRGKSAFTTRRRHHPVSMTRLHQNMGFSSSSSDESSRSNNNNNNIDETSKWENMYNNYQPQSTTTTTATTPPSNNNNNNSIPKSEIRIITFDLDNTIWKTSTTISHANTILSSILLNKFGIEVRSEVEMGRLFKEFPDRYCGLLTDEHDGGGGGDDDGGGTKVDDGERSNNGRGGEEEGSSDDEYANSVQNVGQTEASSLVGATITEGIDTGVHIQPTQIGKAKKKPVYLTLLRKDAIRSLILQQQEQQQSHGGDNEPLLSPVELEAEVEEAFNLWMKARSESISNNFAYNAVETLFRLKSQLATKKKVYIGAITDGNSNPQSVPELSNLFDFVIRAEDVGVSKPDKRVYKAAVGQVMAQLMMDGRSVEDFFLGTESDGDDSGGSVGVDASYLISESSISGGGSRKSLQEGGQSLTWKDVDPEAVEAFSDAVGPWWVHIGDDFFKDIVAAKEFRMRSVWVRELIGGAEAFGGGGGSGAPSPGGKNKRSVEDLVNDIAKNDGPVKMEIGESDFLTSALHEEFSDAILDRLAHLGDLLIQWNVEGGSEGKDGEAFINREEVENIPDTILQNIELATTSASSSEDLPATKFCIFCGEKVPMVAKFCPGCGERQ
jgi:FMN phosphatase YigB (HAD superfamily)